MFGCLENFLLHYQLWPCGSPKSTMVKYGQNYVFFCHVKTFTFEKWKKFICVHKQCFDIMTFINTYVGLWHSSIVHSLVVLLHWNIHRNDRNIYSWILKFIIPRWLCHIIRHHVVRIFLIYITLFDKRNGLNHPHYT